MKIYFFIFCQTIEYKFMITKIFVYSHRIDILLKQIGLLAKT